MKIPRDGSAFVPARKSKRTAAFDHFQGGTLWSIPRLAWMAIPDRMLRLFLSVMLMFSTAVCFGQLSGVSNQGGPGQQTESKPRTFSGQVINSVTGQPIARALVQLGGEHAMLTDHEGRFEFDNAAGDAAAAFVTKPGFFAQDNEGISPGEPITLQLIPEAILFGTITDQTGQPIQDLTVGLKELQVARGLRHWQQSQSTTTNAEGEFRFAELPAGRYSLATGFKIEGLPQAASSVAFLPV